MSKPKPKHKPQIVSITPLKTQFKIEKHIPFPPRKKENPYLDTFRAMSINDSFLVGNNDGVIKKVKYYSHRYGKENSVTFAFRLVKEGCRCWRIK